MDRANLIPSGIDNGWRYRTARGYRTNPTLCQTAASQATRRERLSFGDRSPGFGVLLADWHEGLDKQDTVRPGDSMVGQVRRDKVGIPNDHLARLPRGGDGDRSL